MYAVLPMQLERATKFMPRKTLIASATTLAIFALLCASHAPAAESPAIASKKYDSGYDTMARIAVDLYRALPPENRRALTATPVLLDKVKAPFLQPGESSRGGTNSSIIYVSTPLFDLLNYVSHAKAVDQVDHGFFAKAVNSLACESPDKGLTELYAPTHPKSWSFNTMNWQLSNFNRMAAGLTAIEMAHHYLGHYKQYASQLSDAKNPVPLYSVLPPSEWRKAVLAGSRNALDCGLAPEGLIVLYDAISRMKQRPSWAVQIMPPTAEVSILRLELKRVEASFFDMRTASTNSMSWSW